MWNLIKAIKKGADASCKMPLCLCFRDCSVLASWISVFLWLLAIVYVLFDAKSTTNQPLLTLVTLSKTLWAWHGFLLYWITWYCCAWRWKSIVEYWQFHVIQPNNILGGWINWTSDRICDLAQGYLNVKELVSMGSFSIVVSLFLKKYLPTSATCFSFLPRNWKQWDLKLCYLTSIAHVYSSDSQTVHTAFMLFYIKQAIPCCSVNIHGFIWICLFKGEK